MVSFTTIFFLAPRHHRATGQSTCGAARTLAEGGADLGYRGCHEVIILDLACSQRLLVWLVLEGFWVTKVRAKVLFFMVFLRKLFGKVCTILVPDHLYQTYEVFNL